MAIKENKKGTKLKNTKVNTTALLGCMATMMAFYGLVEFPLHKKVVEEPQKQEVMQEETLSEIIIERLIYDKSLQTITDLQNMLKNCEEEYIKLYGKKYGYESTVFFISNRYLEKIQKENREVSLEEAKGNIYAFITQGQQLDGVIMGGDEEKIKKFLHLTR